MARIEQLDRARNCLCFPRVTRSGVGCAQRVGSLAIPCMTVLTATLTCPNCSHTEDGDHANERLRALLRVLGMPNGSSDETWRLLRLLLVRLEPMPAPAE